MTRDLAITCDGMDTDYLLRDWRWLVHQSAKPLMVGIFGDWIFGAPDHTIWHLDLLEGQFRQVAASPAAFNAMKTEEQYRDAWFGADWADIALNHGLMPANDQCLGWILHPILGGQFSVTNIDVHLLVVYQAVMGQLFRQIIHGRVT